MVRADGCERGGIRWLAGLIREPDTCEAVEYQLITLGLRLRQLGTAELSWRDLLVICRQAPEGSPIHRALDPEWSLWSWETLLLGQLVNYAALIAHLTRGGRRKFEPPIKLPGDESTTHEVIEADTIPMDEIYDWVAQAMAGTTE